MKKALSILLVFALLVSFGIFAMGSSDTTTNDSTPATTEESETVATLPPTDNMLGDYRVTIDSCRLATNYSGDDIVIVKYIFENVKDEDSSSFIWSVTDKVYQNGIGLKPAYSVDDSYNYDSSNKSKDVKIGAVLEVEIAYILNDTTSPIEVELSKWLGWDDKKITKVFEFPK